jgi:hypothetical protein
LHRVNLVARVLTALEWAACSVSFTAVFAISPARAAGPPPPLGDTDIFNAYVADHETYDSNLYRLPANVGPISTVVSPNATREDYANTITLGGDGQWVLGRQVFVANLHIDENRFAHNDALNNTAGTATGLWNWRVGPYFSGQVGAEYNRGLASFAELRYLGRDVVDTENYFGNVRYQLGPRWALTGDLRTMDTTHSAQAVAFNDFRDRLVSGGIEYATGVDDTFSLEFHHYVGRYPNNFLLNGATFVSDYHEDFPQFWVKYALTDKTQFNANVGHLKRIYDDAVGGTYSGIIWRASLDWQATEKIGFLVKSWHEIHAYSVSESDYFVSQGGSLAPLWNATEKISLSLVASYEDQKYITNSISTIVLGSRHDKFIAEQLNLYYTPRDKWSVNLFVRHEQRTSNQPIGYGDQVAAVSLTYKFW